MAFDAFADSDINTPDGYWNPVTEWDPPSTSPSSDVDVVAGPQVSFDNKKDALSQLYELGKSKPEYMELYLQLLAERENTSSARKWYEEMSSTQYQRAYKDLEKAGINPYLALQSLGGAGSGSVQPAGTWSTSPYANKMNSLNQKQTADANMLKAILGIGTTLAAIIALML